MSNSCTYVKCPVLAGDKRTAAHCCLGVVDSTVVFKGTRAQAQREANTTRGEPNDVDKKPSQ